MSQQIGCAGEASGATTRPDSVMSWFVRRGGASKPLRARIFCLPHGGAGASVFYSWQELADDGIEVVAIQLPGREQRIAEPPERSIIKIRDLLAGPLLDYAGSIPFALLGHSMGALVAYELCHALRDSPNAPRTLVVAGAAAAHLPRTQPDVHALPDAEFRRHITMLNGTPKELLDDPTWQSMLIPVMRADFEACETYVHQERQALRLSLIALGGSRDPLATREEVERWADLNAGPNSLRIFDGDHFFLFSHVKEVIGLTAQSMLDGSDG